VDHIHDIVAHGHGVGEPPLPCPVTNQIPGVTLQSLLDQDGRAAAWDDLIGLGRVLHELACGRSAC
jgi:hypothetical protein